MKEEECAWSEGMSWQPWSESPGNVGNQILQFGSTKLERQCDCRWSGETLFRLLGFSGWF